MKTNKVLIFDNLRLTCSNFVITNGIKQTIQKKPWDLYHTVGFHRKTVGCGYFLAAPKFFHNFVSFYPILMFLTILESGDKTNTIGDEFKTIRLIMINT
jgi:hypothetical protein